jgi:hypothetical protein
VAYNTANSISELELARMRSERTRRASQAVLPAIKMIIGEWYVDEFGVRAREIRAHE